MSDTPRVVRAFLLTDIEGSTRLWEDHPGAMSTALARHDELIRSWASRTGGQVVRTKGEGDSAFMVFEDPADAVACAARLQEAMRDEPWPSPARIRVRMGIHVGEAESRAGDFYGPVVNRCARIRGVAHGEQVLLSEEVAEAVEERLPPGSALRDLGLHRFKDLLQPTRVYQLVVPGLPSEFPALHTLDAQGHNLPVQPTTFIGRDQEVRQVRKLAEQSPILTLVGPGGVGKTRLALQVAAEVVEEHPDGVWFVDLAAIVADAEVPVRVAAALGLRDTGDRPVGDMVVEHLRRRRALLVLDNCEQVAESVALFIADVVSVAAQMRLLATSREPLRVYGERVYRVEPLEIPIGHAPAEELVTYDAVRLFGERADLADHAFTIDQRSAPVVAAICSHLDGIPLAIELAAAQVGYLSVDDIASALTDRLASGHGPRTVALRQQTLRGTLDWSYDLLSVAERTLFRRLGVFAGPFDAHAASDVCAGEPLGAEEVPVLLEALADRSLITAVEHGDVHRFRLLQTVRQYANERLAEAGEEPIYRFRHLERGRRSAVEAHALLAGPEQARALDLLEGQLDELSAALSWEDGDLEIQMQTATLLPHFWEIRGHAAASRALLEQLVGRASGDEASYPRLLETKARLDWYVGAQDDARLGYRTVLEEADRRADTELRRLAVFGLGNVAYATGDHDAARDWFEEALRLARPGDERAVMLPLSRLAVVAFARGDNETTIALLDDALDLAERLGDENQVIRLLSIRALAQKRTGQRAQARSTFESCLETARRLGDREMVGNCLVNIGNLAFEDGDLAGATAMFEEALTLARQTGDRDREAFYIGNLGGAQLGAGNTDEAAHTYREGLQLAEDLGILHLRTLFSINLGNVAVLTGDWHVARQRHLDGLRLAHSADERPLVGAALLGVGAALCGLAEPQRGLRLIGAAVGQLASMGIDLDPVERSLVARATETSGCDGPQRQALLDEGEGLDPAAASALALEGSGSPEPPP